MSQQDQSSRWNRRYEGRDPAQDVPAQVLVWYSHLLPATGRALDVASGLGGNALCLARRGLDTEAWDIADAAVESLNRVAVAHALPLNARVRDVESAPPPPATFDVITVSRFLYRPLCAALAEALRPGGVLFYQTFTRLKPGGNGPRNPAFLLDDGELLRLFSTLRPVVYREERDLGDVSQGFRDQAMLVALRPD